MLFKKRRPLSPVSPVFGSQRLAAECILNKRSISPSRQALPSRLLRSSRLLFWAEAHLILLQMPLLGSQVDGLTAETLAASALLLLRQTPATGECPGEETEEQVEEEPLPSTSPAGILGLPSEIVTPGGEPGRSHETRDGRQPAPRPRDQDGQPQEVAVVAAPTGSGAAPSPGRLCLPLVMPPNHAFFRLAGLQPGVTLRPSNPEGARFYPPASVRSCSLLHEVRAPLAEEPLCEEEACRLVLLAEQPAAHCVRYQKLELNQRHLTSAAEMLGKGFCF